ncbi:MAG: sodium:proton antiporter, partial [Lachnospiraceae bacterium]|nr:sodium:proton antiporter [Lachnospiraceae bacterium]
MGKKRTAYSEDVMDIVTLVELAMTGYFAWQVLFAGAEVKLTIPYLAGLGIGFHMDGFRAVYTFLTALAWFLTACFSKEYLKGEHHTNRYRMFFQFTLAATTGVFMANNLYTMFMFFEIMSFVSFPLVIQEETPEAKEAGMSYFAVAVIGGLLILMGIVLVYSQ